MVYIGARCRDVRAVSPTGTEFATGTVLGTERTLATGAQNISRGGNGRCSLLSRRVIQWLSCISRYAYRRPAAVKFAAD